MSERSRPLERSQFVKFISLSTRWNDNDVYGHLNNVVYFEIFDTAINLFLINNRLLDIDRGGIIGLVVDNRCSYFSSVGFPDVLDVGIRVSKVGKTSINYEIGIFKKYAELSSAVGNFVHVYVDRVVRKPVPISDEFRKKIHDLLQVVV